MHTYVLNIFFYPNYQYCIYVSSSRSYSSITLYILSANGRFNCSSKTIFISKRFFRVKDLWSPKILLRISHRYYFGSPHTSCSLWRNKWATKAFFTQLCQVEYGFYAFGILFENLFFDSLFVRKKNKSRNKF